MQIIILENRGGIAREHQWRLNVRRTLLFGGLMVVLVVLAATSWLLERSGSVFGDPGVDRAIVERWHENVADDSAALALLRQATRAQVDELARRTGELQIRMARIEALGQRMAMAARVNSDELDFVALPGVGGADGASDVPEHARGTLVPLDLQALRAAVDEAEERLALRRTQLEVLDDHLIERRIRSEVFVAGRPLARGWMSSPFGRRLDPWTGQPSWHRGVDFAGKKGTDVLATATGVVTKTGSDRDYGMYLELSHGNGFTTRYAHHSELLVGRGDVVKRGQVIARLGSTGRSTGPHVHFEVRKDGRRVNPADYIRRQVPDVP